MEKVIEQIRLKADSCGDATKEQRARKGAYIDCLVLLKEALRQCNVSGRSEQLKGKYTEHFIEWRDKYFDYNPILVEWKTKNRNERYTTKQILSRYERAMLKSPFNCH